MGFSHLHTHASLGSRLDAVSSSEDYAKRALKFGHKAIAITDHGRTNGIFEHQVECLKQGIKPIVGIEMYLCDKLEDIGSDEKRIRSKNNHVILLVKNKQGYKNYLYLNYLSMKDDKHFYYFPRITTKELFKYSEGLILGTACMAGPFSRLLINGKADIAEKLFIEYLNVFQENIYIEIQLNELTNQIDGCPDGQKTVNDFLIFLGNKYSVPIVLTGDVHYLEKDQYKLQTLSIAIRDKSTIDNLKFELESKELFYHDVPDYIDFNKRFKYNYKEEDIISWCNNTEEISNKTDFLIPTRKKMFLPKITDNDDSSLILEAKSGLEKRFGLAYSKIPSEYRKRLEKELEVIIRKGYSSYFMIVYDITKYSIKEGIYGRFGRGSASGSLVGYALEIHNLDPIKNNLLFERFLSESRAPDMVVDYFGEV